MTTRETSETSETRDGRRVHHALVRPRVTGPRMYRHEPDAADYRSFEERFAALAPRLQDVARLLMTGTTNKSIAAQLGTSEQVIKNYVRELFDLLGADTRLQLAMLLMRMDYRL